MRFWTKRCLFPSVCETTCFYYQTWDNYSVYEHDFESPWLWGNSQRVFLPPKQWNGGHVGKPKRNPVRVELFPYVNTFVWFMLHNFAHRNLSQRKSTTYFLLTRFYLFSRKAQKASSVGFGRINMKRGYTTHSQLSVRTKSRTHFVNEWMNFILSVRV